MPWAIRFTRRRRVRARVTTVTKHYQTYKEQSRELILNRLEHFNQYYGYAWKRVAIRNQRRCWGSCSAQKNLNFNYKILFLPPHLQDYIIVHELCHLAEMNHGPAFWELVAKQIPEYGACLQELRHLDRQGLRATQLQKLSEALSQESRAVPVEMNT